MPRQELRVYIKNKGTMINGLRPFSVVYPRPLPPGGTIGIVSPAGISSQDALLRATNALNERGYKVVVGQHAADNAAEQGYAYLAGTDENRACDLNRFLNDSAIDLVLCARGGYGCARIIDRVDYDAVKRDPKPIVGYSDITALSLAVAARTGVVSFSGIMATAGHGFGEDTLDPFSEASFWQAVGENGFRSTYNPPENFAPWVVHRAPASGDTITGRVFPVCLSLLTALLGTPYLPNLDGAVLVIEDIHEELYSVDRMLTQLRLAGVLDKLAAVLIGSFNGMDSEEDARLAAGVPRLVLENTPATVAVASGIAYGHIRCRLTLPTGAPSTINLTNGTLRFDNTAEPR